MALTRKERKALKKLRKLTGQVADEQRVVLGHAGSVLQEAGRQARNMSDTHIAPRVSNAYETVRPTVESSTRAVKGFFGRVGNRVTPVAGAALTKAVATLENADKKDLAKSLKKFGKDRGLVKKSRRGRRIGGVFALLLGLGAAAAVGYSLWQAFRDDEDVWVAPESAE